MSDYIRRLHVMFNDGSKTGERLGKQYTIDSFQIAMVCTHNGLSGWYSGDDFCSSGKEKKRAKENDTDN